MSEYQKLREELRKRDMFEMGMAMTDMHNIYKVIIESEKAMVKDQSADENEASEPAPMVKQLSYAKTASLGLSMEDRKSSSPELSSGHQNKRLSQEKSMDSSDECMIPARSPNSSQKESRDTHNFNKSKSRSPHNIVGTPEGMNNNKRANQKQNTNMRQEDRWPKFKINPLNFVDNPRDSRLVSHHRSAGDKGIGGGSSDINEKAVQTRMYIHLRNISDICHVQRMSSAETILQWGTAIKVSERERSTDKNVISDEETLEFDEDKKQPEASTSFGFVDETKRRRKICANKTAIYNYGGVSDDEQDNSDEDFETTMKRRKRVGSSVRKKASSTRTTERESVEPVSKSRTARNASAEKKFADPVTNIDVSDQCATTDDEIKDGPPKKARRSKSEDTEAVYPRRIAPPKPGPKWIKLGARKPLHPSSNESRARKPNDDENETNARASRQKKSNVSLDEKEIAEALEEKIDEDDEDNNSITKVSVNTAEIRPLRISSRMKMQSERLVQLQELEKEKEKIRRDQERIKEEMVRREKVERVQQRIREENEKQRMQEELEKHKAEREDEWKIFVAQGNKKRTDERTDLHPDGRPQNNEIMRDARDNRSITIESDDERINENGPATESSSDRVRCPICNRAFTIEEIEAHAGACEEFDECPPGVSRSSSPTLTPTKKTTSYAQRSSSSQLFECEVCDVFATNNGKKFENHLSECLKRKKYGEPFTPDAIVEVPTSPIRTLRTISEQTDSEINYKSQFVPKTKSNRGGGGKKRKR